jgi:riboflavin transporter FmnP
MKKQIFEKDLQMNTKSVALIAIFSAMAIILNAIRIPAFYWPGMFYLISDIPVLVAFLLFGFKIGFLVEAIQILGQEIFFPVGPAGIVFYPMGFFIHLFMFSGIYLASKFINRGTASDVRVETRKATLHFTGFAAFFRGAFMPIIDFGLLYYVLLPLVLGTAIPLVYIQGLVASFIIYNVTSALYVVPIAYLIAIKTKKHFRIDPAIKI